MFAGHLTSLGAQISRQLGVSLASASKMRAGSLLPHVRHWDALGHCRRNNDWRLKRRALNGLPCWTGLGVKKLKPCSDLPRLNVGS